MAGLLETDEMAIREGLEPAGLESKVAGGRQAQEEEGRRCGTDDIRPLERPSCTGRQLFHRGMWVDEGQGYLKCWSRQR